MKTFLQLPGGTQKATMVEAFEHLFRIFKNTFSWFLKAVTSVTQFKGNSLFEYKNK